MRLIEFKLVTAKTDTLIPGFRGANCHFDYRKYEDRYPHHRADYDKLVVSIFHKGVLKPLITFANEDGHFILIGMRRWEIMMRMASYDYCQVCLISNEDPGDWLSPDIDRLNELKQKIGTTKY